MTGYLKLAAVGAVTALASFATLTALRLSKIKNNIKTRNGFPSKAEIIQGQLQLTLPVTILNYSGFTLTPKRVRVEVTYKDKNGNDVQLGISPKIIPSLLLKKDDVFTPSFILDVDPAALVGLKQDSSVTVSVKFDYWKLPVQIDTDIKVSDFVPTDLINTIKNKLGSLLKKLGLGNPTAELIWVNPDYNKTLSYQPQNTLTPAIPISGYLPTLNRVADCL